MSIPRLAAGATAPRPAPARTRPPLEAVETGRRRRPAIRHAIVCVVVLFSIVVAQLLMSIVLTQGAYQLESLQGSATQLQRQVQISQVQLQKASSPQNLASQAAALGMVGDGNPVYLRLSDGAVLGAPAQGSTPAAGQNLVPNALVVPPAVPADTAPAPQEPAAATAPPAGEDGPGASAPAPADALVPWQGELPAPATH